jgi:hypothetical protein
VLVIQLACWCAPLADSTTRTLSQRPRDCVGKPCILMMLLALACSASAAKQASQHRSASYPLATSTGSNFLLGSQERPATKTVGERSLTN